MALVGSQIVKPLRSSRYFQVGIRAPNKVRIVFFLIDRKAFLTLLTKAVWNYPDGRKPIHRIKGLKRQMIVLCAEMGTTGANIKVETTSVRF